MGGMVWTFSGTGIQVVVQLLTIMALGRLLTPAEFGLMGAATVVIACSQIVSQIGVGPAIIQRRVLEPVHLRVAVTLSFALGTLLGAIVWFGAEAIAAFYRMPDLVPILRAVAFLFPLDGLNTVAPYGDDLYQKARPTLAHTRKDVLKIDEYHGLHPRMRELPSTRAWREF